MSKSIFEQLNIKWILLIGLIVHLPMLSNGFTYYSDDIYVLNNLLVHKINGSTVHALFTTYFDGHYHPLTLLSLAITYLFSGASALGYQLTNLGFHLINCWLIYKILTQLELRKNIILLSTLIFAIHPLNVESVARITERKDTQYVLFLLMAIYFFVAFCKDESKRKFYIICIACFILSLLSKGQAVVFPLMLYVISWYQLKTSGQKIKHKFIAPLFIFSIFFVYLNYRAQLVTGYLSETEAITIKQIIAYPVTIVSSYVFKLFFPFRLSAQYFIPAINSLSIIYAAFVLLLIAGVYILWRNKKYVALSGVLFYVISVFPMLRIIPVSENFMPDRYNYLGLMGFGIFFSSMFFELADKYKKYNLYYIFLAWVIVIAGLCFKRTTIWKNGFTIWEDAYTKYPQDEFATLNYGTYLTSTKKDVKQGLSLFQKSIALNPDNMITRVNYVNTLSSLGKKEESLAAVKEIINAKPVGASNITNRAVILLQYGRPKESIIEFDKAVALKPEFAKNRINRAGYYFNQFLFDKALAELDTLENLHSNYIDLIYFMRTAIYIDQGNQQLAKKSIEVLRDLHADPKQVKVLQEKISLLSLMASDDISKMDQSEKINYASALYTKGMYYHAFVLLSELLKKDPASEKIINNITACAFKLSRPELMQEYIGMLKKNNYAVNEKAVNYLFGLGISL